MTTSDPTPAARELTHASFFSGVGGLDLGLERAGWRTVSFSEIDPYACAVLAHRWPGVPNLGSIVDLADRADGEPDATWAHAALWTGGFPCQDLSVAGKRRGLAGARSGLAFAFLDLVERHRPPAVLLENVPGLLSSHAGRDLGALLGRLGELGYGWAYRVLNAQHFGVPQRRRRVFILALRRGGHPDPDGSAAVLAVGTRCGRDHAAEREAWARAAGRTAESFDRPGWGGITDALGAPGSTGRLDPNGKSFVVGTFTAGAHPGSYNGQDAYTGHLVPVVGPPPDPRGDGAPDGLAGRAHDRAGVAWAKRKRAQSEADDETWGRADVTPTINSFDVGDARAVTLIANALDQQRGGADDNGHLVTQTLAPMDDPLLPVGLDSHRYRCCGNGVVAPVAEWLGARVAAWARAVAQEDAA